MKKLFFPAVAALAMGLASCSSDEVNPGNGGGTVNYAEGGYVRLSINMPSVKGTRTTTSDPSNDNFDDGLANEYAVKDATLVLFDGASGDKEADLKFHSAYKLTTGMEMEDANTQITSMTKIVKKTDDKGHGGKLCALVVLNHNDLMEVTSDNKLVLKTHSAPATTPTPFSGKFSDFGKALSTIAPDATPSTVEGYVPAPKFASSVSAKGIFMTNAPLSDKSGNTANPNVPSGANVTTLVDVSNSVYNTEKEAQNAPAADIFVERGVAKVTFSKEESDGKGIGKLDGAEFKKTGNEMDYEIVGWNLDVTNRESYLVRQVTNKKFGLYSSDATSTGNKFRFVGGDKITAQTGGATTTGGTTNTNTKEFYRIYWAEDPNYDNFVAPHNEGGTIVGSEKFNRLENSLSLSNKFEAGNPQYCYENTFNVTHQKQNETTRVVIAIKLRHNGDTKYSDLYAFNGDRSKLYKLDGAKERIKKAIVNVLQEKEGFSNLQASNINDADIVLTERKPETGQMAVKEFKATKAGETSAITFAKGGDEVEAVNHELGVITKYVDGVAYYPVRIKHFGDDSTPWKESQGVTAGGIDKVYPNSTGAGETQEDRFLGRYGVLRNNWYNLSVGKVSGPGSPAIPETEDIPDDELYNYISVRINILSWAKRTQHENL